MWWLALWVSVTIAGGLGTVASWNSMRFGRRVAREVREMNARPGPTAPTAPQARVPPPVERYLGKAIDGRGTAIRSVRLRHRGSFRPSLSGSWLPIRGEQYFTSDPPAFIWWGRVKMAPGLWIDARDRAVDGHGNMFVTAESSVTIANSSGPELDQGALLRLLGEMVWFPTVFRDERYVRWSAVDDRRARATLHVNGRTVSGVFEFDSDGLPAKFSAERYRDLGGSRNALTPFIGQLDDFRRVEGVLVPYRVVAAWIVDGKTAEYARFEIQQLEFDRPEPW